MRGFLFIVALSVLIPFSAAAAGSEAVERTEDEVKSFTLSDPSDLDEDKVEHLDSVVVSASRAGRNTPVTYTMVEKGELRGTNPLNSLPMTLNLQPSVVAVNEGGTGLGYSKMTVRGSKGTQINVTLNGITLNDSESQEVFWVNIPCLSSILSSVQLQRGLGTSANGAGAFGASINMSTASVGSEPYGSAEVGYGSYNTFMATVSAGTGLTKSGVYFDFAYSRGYTDGYIRNAKAKEQSVFAVLGWMNETNSLKLTYLMGDQQTGITWNGINLADYERDRRYNGAGEYYDQYGNVHYYDNETDNYTQHHLQLTYIHQFDRNVVWNTTLNYTKGDGYDEQYKTGKKMSAYGLPDMSQTTWQQNPDTGEIEAVTTSKSDFITRKEMDNGYWVVNSDVRYTGEKISVTGGVNLSRYNGAHFGKVLWNSSLGDSYDYASFNADRSWYFNNALKQELNIFARTEYTPLGWLTVYLDLQYRGISLRMSGIDDDKAALDYNTKWNFFNPRAGVTFNWERHKAYISAALGGREPGRSDIKDVIASNNQGGEKEELKPEKMVDVELGYVFTAEKVIASANLYFMEYFEMLLETGRLSDSGYSIKENAGRGYRRGVELAVAWQAAPWLRIDANTTLSLNKLRNYTGYIPCYDADYNFLGNERIEYGRSTMLMSPTVVAMAQLSFTPFKNVSNNSLKTTTLSINGKYVGKQYLDNTASDERMVPGYFVSNLSLTHRFNLRKGSLGLGGYVNNLFNNKYYADGWVSMEKSGDSTITYLGIFPQATTNLMLKISYNF